MQVDDCLQPILLAPVHRLEQVRILSLRIDPFLAIDSPIANGNPDMVQAIGSDGGEIAFRNPVVPVRGEHPSGFDGSILLAVGILVNDSVVARTGEDGGRDPWLH